MGGYLLRRLALILPTLLGILLINFAIVQAAPGGPVDQPSRACRASTAAARWGVAGRVGMALWNRSATARPASIRSWWPPWSASTASTSRRCNGSG